MITSIIQKKNKNKTKEVNSPLLDIKAEPYERNIADIKLYYDEIRKLRHDMNHCIQCIYTLIHNNKYDEAKAYLNELISEKISGCNPIVITNSEVVNAVMSSKLQRCKYNDINIKYEITGSIEKIKDVDISILLGNLLDNAIEGCMKLKENRCIHLKVFNEKNYLVILLNNSIASSVLKKNPLLMTTKRNKLIHGFGISSIKDIVKAYNGMIKIYEEKKLFKVDIWLNLGEV